MRNRRLMVVLAAGLVCAGLLGGGYAWRQHQLNARALASLEHGMAAVASGDHQRALDQIGRYLQRYGQERDPEALYRYADARSRVPLPNGKHTQQAIGLLRLAVEREPGLDGATSRLLELYLEAGFGQETLALAARMREARPDDAQALQAEAITLTRLQRYDEALTCARTLAEADPENIQNQLLTLSLLQRTGGTNESLLAYAEEQFQASEGAARMEVVRSVAFEMTGNRAEAAAAAERAAENPGGDAEFIGTLEKLLDRLGRYEASLRLLERTAAGSKDPALARSYAQRLYEHGDYAALIEFAGTVPPSEQDSTVLVFHAMAQAQLGAGVACASLVGVLDGRIGDSAAETWAPLLRAVFVDRDRAPQEIAAACRAALIWDAGNPHIHHIMAVAFERLGESSQAIGAWRTAIRLAPAWNEPILRIAASLSAMGMQEEATRFALEALNRAPENPVSAAKAAAIIGADLDGLAPDNEAQLLKLLENIHAAMPLEPTTLPLYVELMCRSGERNAALEQVNAALEVGGRIPPASMLQLARTSDRHDLGAGEACLAAAAGAAEAAPELALMRAAKLRDGGDPAGGRLLLEEAAGAAGESVEWRLALARYVESIGAEDAPAAWARAADGAADNPAIQKLTLASNAAWNDVELVERIVARLEAATGEEGIAWREAKARWLLMTDASEKAAAEASVLLNDVLRTAIPRAQHYTLMATALERLNNPRGAVENLERALELDSESKSILIELSRLSMLRGEQGRSIEYLTEALESGRLTAAETRRAAAMLAVHEDGARAAELLLASHGADESETPADPMLAQIYRQSGAFGRAEEVARKVLAADPSPEAAAFLADLLASQGRLEEARKELDTLNGASAAPGVREFIRAEHERRYGEADEAEALYRAASAAAGSNPGIWRRYIGFTAARGRVVDAASLIAEAKAACPGDGGLVELAALEGLFRAVADHPMAPPFVVSAIEAPSMTADAAPVLEALRDVPASDPAALAMQFKQLVDRSPRYLPLQVQLVRLYGSLGRHDEAASLAAQAMSGFPSAEEPAQLAAEAYGAAGKWAEALNAATEWRRRSSTRTIAADTLIAQAQIRLDRAPEALDTIRPYLEGGGDSAFSPMHAQHIQALIGSGAIDEADALIEGRLAVSTEWRMAAVRIAAANMPTGADAARWLEMAARAIPADAEDERSTLAAAWFTVAERHGDAAYRAQARTILVDLAERPDSGARTYLALAIVADRDGDAAAAETNYRRALERDPELSVAQNNLAMLLVTTGGDVDEAIRLATLAVEAAPDNASYRDTLAHASAAAGDFDTALANLDRATALEPGESKWAVRREAMAERREASLEAAPSS